MRKRLFFMMLSSVMAMAAMALPVTEKKAMEIAAGLIAGGEGKMVNTSVAQAAKGLNSSSATPPYYIVSRGEGKGFVIISGDDCLPTVLGYTESGNYDESDMPEAFRDWLQYRADIISYAQAKGLNSTYDEGAAITAAAAARPQDVPELLKTLWHQNSPYNDKCPTHVDGGRCVTGCVATAASQVIYYWRREANKETAYDTPKYKFGSEMNATDDFVIPKGTPLNWDLMKNSYSSSDSQASKEAVATLVATVGMSGYLTYGRSTGGQINDQRNVFSGQFGLNGGTCVYKSGRYSEDGWANLLYGELIQGRPILYCGYNSSRGGHAVVCDGYRASDGLFHINFGWGSGYNGYFSVVDGEQGWGFNEGEQGCVYGVYPKRLMADVTLKMPEKVYKNVKSHITMNIDNHGTLPLSEFYLFASSSSSYPTKLTDAKATDMETVVKSDASGKASFYYTPTSTTKQYITITDRNLAVLAREVITPELSKPDLRLMNVEASTTGEENIVEGINYPKVYGTSALAYLEVKNFDQSDWSGYAKAFVHESVDNGATWTTKTLTNNKAYLPADNTAKLQFIVTSMKVGALYRVTLNHAWGQTTPYDSVSIAENAKDTIAYFSCAGASTNAMKATLNGNVLKFTGVWDGYAFRSNVTRSANAAATVYDLTECTNVGMVPQLDFPSANALIYAPSGATGMNVITPDGMCSQLSLTVGADFAPVAAFKAQSAVLNIVQEANRWYMITVPFTCIVPDGIIAREVTTVHSRSSRAIASKLTNVSRLEAGKTYLIMTSSDRRQTLMAADELCDVSAELSKDIIDPAFVGTFTATQVPDGSKVIDGYGTTSDQTFSVAATGTKSVALRGYFYDSSMKTALYNFKAAPNTTDAEYANLGRNIQALYNAYSENYRFVSTAANAALQDSIAKAEKEFSLPSMTSSAVKAYNARLQAFLDEYPDMILYGDANNDGEITISDANMVVNQFLGVEPKGINLRRADADRDGQVTVGDANIIVNTFLGGE